MTDLEYFVSQFRDEIIIWLKAEPGVTPEKIESLRQTADKLLVQAQLQSEQAGAILDILEHPEWIYPAQLNPTSSPGQS